MIRNHKQHRFAWLILPVLALLAAHAVHAEPRLYDVEVIVFTNDSSGSDDEVMNQPGSDAVNARGSFPGNEFTELTSGSYRLNNIRGGLAASRGYRVLFHRAWRQPAYDRARAVDYPLHSLADNGRDSVEGTITLIKERYLHLDVNLLLMTAGGGTPALYADGPGSRPAFRLAEKRRIKSSETHYFDHPRFGMIARVTPYVSPDEPATPEPAGEGMPDDTAGSGQEDEPVSAQDQLTR
ncbi:MAG TPA: CsiV family protein [Gammaproteobacteria bacterium]|nr:CsiV family protein [Gammaproteobacteria bacterium]